MDSQSTAPTPEETTASVRADVNALKKVIPMSEKESSKQRIGSFFNELEQETASLTDEEFTGLERMIMERRGRIAAYVVVAQIDTAQPCNLRLSCSEISFDVHVCMTRNTQGRLNSEPGQLESSSAGTGQLESPSAGTGFEHPDSSVYRTGRRNELLLTTACSLA